MDDISQDFSDDDWGPPGKEPRFGLEKFEDFKSHYENYMNEIGIACSAVDNAKLLSAYNMIESRLGQPLFVFGNGGSAAIASHFCADYNKNIHTDTDIVCRAICLTDNVPTLTAVSNDSHYVYAFSQQLQIYSPENGLVLAVSSSGNSPNIVNGLAAANKMKIPSIALVGFNGGSVKENNLADTIIHVPSNNYGIVEDVHMMILHCIIQRIRKKFAHGTPKL